VSRLIYITASFKFDTQRCYDYVVIVDPDTGGFTCLLTVRKRANVATQYEYKTVLTDKRLDSEWWCII